MKAQVKKAAKTGAYTAFREISPAELELIAGGKGVPGAESVNYTSDDGGDDGNDDGPGDNGGGDNGGGDNGGGDSGDIPVVVIVGHTDPAPVDTGHDHGGSNDTPISNDHGGGGGGSDDVQLAQAQAQFIKTMSKVVLAAKTAADLMKQVETLEKNNPAYSFTVDITVKYANGETTFEGKLHVEVKKAG